MRKFHPPDCFMWACDCTTSCKAKERDLDMEVVYAEFRASAVLEPFTKDFAGIVQCYEWFYDPAKEKFIFKIFRAKEVK